MIFRGRVIRT